MDNKYIRAIRSRVIRYSKTKFYYKWMYPAYWHVILTKKTCHKKEQNVGPYFAARPNPGAGIGHQMANWIAGLWYAKKFNVPFAHIPFSNQGWDDFLGFGQNREKLDKLKSEGYKIRRLPMFDEENHSHITMIEDIIKSYFGKKVILLCEQDQFYKDQYGVIEEIQESFYSAKEREKNNLIFSPEMFNIAIHVRRGDIVQTTGRENANLTMRYQTNEYFVNALKNVLSLYADKDNVQIYLFSQGNESDFEDFSCFNNLHLCLEMGAKDSFLHMVYADALITSKSSFSYKPALLNRGIKFCPVDFWHGYPKSEKWFMLDSKGDILVN